MIQPVQELSLYHVHCTKDGTVIQVDITLAQDGKVTVYCPKCGRMYLVEV